MQNRFVCRSDLSRRPKHRGLPRQRFNPDCRNKTTRNERTKQSLRGDRIGGPTINKRYRGKTSRLAMRLRQQSSRVRPKKLINSTDVHLCQRLHHRSVIGNIQRKKKPTARQGGSSRNDIPCPTTDWERRVKHLNMATQNGRRFTRKPHASGRFQTCVELFSDYGTAAFRLERFRFTGFANGPRLSHRREPGPVAPLPATPSRHRRPHRSPAGSHRLQAASANRPAFRRSPARPEQHLSSMPDH